MDAAESALVAASGVMSSSPQASAQTLRVLLRHLQPSQEYVLVAGGDAVMNLPSCAQRLLKRIDPRALTICLAAASDEADQSNWEELAKLCPLVEQRQSVESQATLYVCREF
ncbi:MAG: hypothetical protein R3C56_00505 [Pirellulaceae bacterium]